jgi:hypothetical protein
MISQLTNTRLKVILTNEDAAICTGAAKASYPGVSCHVTDRMATRAGVIYLMRKGDRADFAKILAFADTVYKNAAEKHFARACM